VNGEVQKVFITITFLVSMKFFWLSRLKGKEKRGEGGTFISNMVI
jgi:hypothetical protein